MLLVMALAIGISAYALVGIGDQDKVPTDLVGYGVVLRRLRGRLPHRRPPVRAVRGPGPAAGRDRTERHRARDDPPHRHRAGRREPGCAVVRAARRYLWTAVSIVGVPHYLDRAARPPAAAAHDVHDRAGRRPPAAAPARARTRRQHQRVPDLDPAAGYSFQPGEVAKICLAILFAGYLVVKRDALALAGRRFIGIDLPRGRDLGPIVLMWLISLGRARVRGRPRIVAAVLRPVRGPALRRDRAAELARGRLLLFAVGAYVGYLAFGHVQARVEGWLHPFSNRDAFYQILQARYGLGWGGILGQGWGGAAHSSRRTPGRTSSRPRSARSSV